jgi:dephospho-CoA kinase
MLIGVTGSFGTGKTTVANMFRKHGFRVINVDRLYRGIFTKNSSLKEKIKKEFETLDRDKIKKAVFSDSRKLRKLNSITHPIIIKELQEGIKTIRNANKKLKKVDIKNKLLGNLKNPIKEVFKKNKDDTRIVVDIPLLFEAKVERMFDKIIVVKCDKKERIKRILRKNKYSKMEIGQIIKSQMPLREKIKKADFVVDNNFGFNDTEKQVKKIMNSLQKP